LIQRIKGIIKMKSKTRSVKQKTALLKSGYIDREPPQNEGLPTGPFKQAGEGYRGCLLVFVPRNEFGILINDTTGGYGYSHLAVDCGELDLPTGKRVMIEATVGRGVHKSFQDEYGERKFVRIYLEKAEVNITEFCDCINSKLGEKFDDEEVLTLGLMHNPERQVCSNLATVCLPEAVRKDIARYQETSFRYYLSRILPFDGPDKIFRLFVTPNGFAKYFGAPRGDQLDGTNQISEPIPARA
jgi:hypothetical protein